MINESDRKSFKECYSKLEIANEEFEKFEKLKTDEERIEFASELVPDEKMPLIEKIQNGKDGKEAEELREAGNKAFGRADFKTALNCYTKSIMKTPQTDDTTNLALALANRSAVFYHLQEYRHAIDDIDIVLVLNYPKEMRFKVLERRAKSLLALEKRDEALSTFKSTIQALDECKLSVEKKIQMQKNMQVMLELMSKGTKKSSGRGEYKTNSSGTSREKEKSKPRLSSARNKKYEAACDLIEIKEDSSAGRFASAAAEIAAGDTLLIEKPYCSVLLAEYCETNCQHCFKRTLAPHPCKNCSRVMFCSLKCRDLANYHKYECSILKTLHESGVSVTVLMALRILTQHNLNHFLGLKSKLMEPKETEERYTSSDYVRVYHLVRHEGLRKSKDFFERSVMALFLLRCLKEVGYFENEEKGSPKLSSSEKFIGSLLLRHLQILQFNAHEISELEMKDNKNSDDSKSIFIGGGLYPTLALFNHSCDPGIVRYFEGTKVVVRAAKPIGKGEMVAENYGPIYSQMKKEDRQEKLLAQYWFDCSCVPCREIWPTFGELDKKSIRFRCDARKENGERIGTCGNVLLVPADTEEFMIKCSACGQFTNLFKGLKALQETDIMYKQAIKDANAGNYPAALNIYLEILTALHKILAPPFRDYLLCQQSMRKCMLAMGNKHVKEEP